MIWTCHEKNYQNPQKAASLTFPNEYYSLIGLLLSASIFAELNNSGGSMWTFSPSVRLSCSPVSMTQAEGWMREETSVFVQLCGLKPVAGAEVQFLCSGQEDSGQGWTQTGRTLWSTLSALRVKSFPIHMLHSVSSSCIAPVLNHNP